MILLNQMLKLFDKTFFKFLLGFTAILALSFAVLMVTGYYDMHRADTTASTSVSPGK